MYVDPDAKSSRSMMVAAGIAVGLFAIVATSCTEWQPAHAAEDKGCTQILYSGNRMDIVNLKRVDVIKDIQDSRNITVVTGDRFYNYQLDDKRELVAKFKKCNSVD